MAKLTTLLLACLVAALAACLPACSHYSDYQSNMTYVNNEILDKEETLALEQLRAARANLEKALASGPVAQGSEVEKTYQEAREKYLIIKKEKALRAGRVPSAKDLSDDPELAIPGQPGAPAKRSAAPPVVAPVPDAAPAVSPDPATVPAPAPAPAKNGSSSAAPGPEGAAYTVQKGDTLGAIAKMHHVELRALVAYNALPSQDKISPGQVLRIPTP